MAFVRTAAALVVSATCACSLRTPRAELHVHLDGAVPVEVLWKVCVRRQLELQPGGGVPASPAVVLEHLLRQRPAWRGFDVVNEIIGGDAATIEYVSEEFVRFQAWSGVAYTEVRYDPVRLARSGLARAELPLEDAVASVQRGLAAGAARHGVAVYQILCAMRDKSAEQCFEVATLASNLKSMAMGGVVGMDLAGDEIHYPNGPFVACFRHAKLALGLNTTVHAGEFDLTMAGDVSSAILEMRADRIGHGYAAASDEETMALAKSRRVHFEFCPKSALRHGPELLAALGRLKAWGVSYGLNTDDPSSWIGNTTAEAGETIVRRKLGFTTEDLENSYRAATNAAFGPAAAWLATTASPRWNDSTVIV